MLHAGTFVHMSSSPELHPAFVHTARRKLENESK